jgi:cyclohexanecarboxylate-CoA ligase
MHSANTVMANIIPYAQRLQLDAEDVVLMASPMSHQTGFMYGLMMPIMLKSRAVLQDIWEPKKAVEIINTEKATFTMASTPFPHRPYTHSRREQNSCSHTQDIFMCRRTHTRTIG